MPSCSRTDVKFQGFVGMFPLILTVLNRDYSTVSQGLRVQGSAKHKTPRSMHDQETRTRSSVAMVVFANIPKKDTHQFTNTRS